MRIYYCLKNKFVQYFKVFSWFKFGVTLIIALILVIISAQTLFYIEKRNWDNVPGERVYPLNFLTYVPNVTNLINFYNYFIPSELPKYRLEVSKDNMKKLETAYPDNFFGNLPNKSIWVPAKFIVQGKEYDVEIKNRGFTSRHWRYNKKSWGIKFTGERFNGYENLNFLLPEEKEFLVEDYGYHVARKLGLKTLNSDFVRLKVNGKSYGVYWMVENWDDDFLERNQLSADANFYQEGDPEDIVQGIYKTSFAWDKNTQETQSKDSNYADLEILLDCLNNCSDEEFHDLILKIIDIDNFLAWQAQAVILGDDHQDDFHNIRLYFNSAKGKFEFFPWDVNQFKFDGVFDINYNPLVTRLLSNPDILHRRNQILWDYVSDSDQVTDDIAYYENLWQRTKSAFYKDSVKRYSNWYFNYRVRDRYQKMKNQYDLIKSTLEGDLANKVKVKFFNFDNRVAKISFIVDTFSDLSLNKISHQGNFKNFKLYYDLNNNGVFDFSDELLGSFNKDDKEGLYAVEGFTRRLFANRQEDAPEKLIKIIPTEHNFFIVADRDVDLENGELKFELNNAVTGTKQGTNLKFYDFSAFQYLNQINKDIDDFVEENTIFRKVNKNEVMISSGTYQLKQTIIIPPNLLVTILPGTTLLFDEGISLISYSPINALGTAFQPISFRPLSSNSWGVVGILDTDQASQFTYCQFDGGSESYINGVIFSGMLSSYYTNIDVNNCSFTKAQADDAINIKYSNFMVSSSSFIDNSADALDVDFSAGKVISSNFQDNGNDGVDISGSTLLIEDNFINNNGDKGISIGEKSFPMIVNNLVIKNQVGVAVKDLSEATLVNNTITNNKIGIDSYQKKEIFGGGKSFIYNSIFWGNDKEIVLDQVSDIEIYNSVVQGGWDGLKVVDTDPQFGDTENLDFLSYNKELKDYLNEEILKQYNLKDYSNLGINP